jgi:hypothetical protein
MTSLNVDRSVKQEFDEHKPEGCTQSEFVERLLECWDANDGNGHPVDVDALVEQINHRVASNVEVAAARGVKDALDMELDNEE